MKQMLINYDSPDYKRSRRAYVVQCATQYLATLMATDTVLAKLLTTIGISDVLTGIISSFISMAYVIQLMSIFLVKVKLSAKKIVIIGDTVSIFFFMLLYLIPFMPVSAQVKTVLAVVSVIAAYAGNYLIASICYKWANSFVNPWKRASFSAVKEMFSLFVGMVFSLVIGYVIDRYEGLGNLNGAFLFIAISIFILNICNFICYMMIKSDTQTSKKEETPSFTEVVRYIARNKKFREFILLGIIWSLARNFTIGFMGVFKANDLMLSMLLVQVINVVASLLRLFATTPIGRYSDKYSYTKGFKLGLYIAAAAFLAGIFTNNSTWYLIIIFTVLYNVCQAGTTQNGANMTYLYVDEEYFSQAMAINNCVCGVCGFGVSLLAAKLLAFIQASDNQFLGLHVYGQQVLSAVSFVLVLVGIVFINQVMEKGVRNEGK